MRTYEPLPGQRIGETAKQMVALAQKTKGTVTADFNGIALTAKPRDVLLNRALATAPEEMTVRDKKEWKEFVTASTDGYGQEVISFAERWARLMEGRMANGDALEACAKEAASLANNDGITGLMYGEAVRILSRTWIHGEKLRRWHNPKMQLGTEGQKANKSGTVLNPALLTIG